MRLPFTAKFNLQIKENIILATNFVFLAYSI